jgi:hypothetical protein
LKTGEVLRRQGLGREAEVRPETRRLIGKLLAGLRKSRLLETAVAYEYYAVRSLNGSQMSLEDDRTIQGPLLSAVFPEAKELVIIGCTIGSKLEKQATEYSKNGAVTHGMTLDGIGSAAVDKLVSEALGPISTGVSSRRYEISSPVNPGMPGFPPTEQRNLLGLPNADAIEVSLTGSGVVVPRKSTSVVVGMGPRMTRWTQAEVCARCSRSEACYY